MWSNLGSFDGGLLTEGIKPDDIQKSKDIVFRGWRKFV